MFYYVDIVFFSLVYVYVDIIFSISCMRYVDIAGNGESFICLARYCPGYRKAALPAHMFIIDAKLQYFQSLLRDEAIEVYQSLTITTETNLIDVLTKFWNEFAKDDLKEVARCKWDRAKYNPTAETFSDCLRDYSSAQQVKVRFDFRPAVPASTNLIGYISNIKTVSSK